MEIRPNEAQIYYLDRPKAEVAKTTKEIKATIAKTERISAFLKLLMLIEFMSVNAMFN